MADKSKTVRNITNGLRNLPDSDSFKIAGNGKPEPIFDYSINDLQSQLTAYRLRRRAFSYDEMLLAKLVNLSGDYDLLMIALPVNEEDTEIEWKKSYRTQFSVPPNSLVLGIQCWVDGVNDD